MVLYIGNYLSEKIVRERGIPFRNAAGSNRILRIAVSLRVNNVNVGILSPGNSLRMKPESRKACLSKETEVENIKVFFAKTSTIPVINLIYSTFSIIGRLFYYHRQGELSTAIIYNFSPELLIVTIVLKLFIGAEIINNIEDVSVPMLTDWKRDTEARPVQQIVFYFCMKAIAYMADGFIVPTKKFVEYLPVSNKPVSLVTGCSNVMDNITFETSDPVQVLFSGKIEFEHGIDLLINALSRLDKKHSNNLIVNICGAGPKEYWLRHELQNKDLNFVSFKGFVTDDEYKSLLEKSDICLVLQNPDGRFGNLKIPSKFYEYYTDGKCIISSKSINFEELPEDSYFVCEEYTPENLLFLLEKILPNHDLIKRTKMAAYKFAKENFEFKKVGQNIIQTLRL